MKRLILGIIASSTVFGCSNNAVPNVPQTDGVKTEAVPSEKTGDDMSFSTKGYVCVSTGYTYYYSYEKKRRVYYSYCKQYKYYKNNNTSGGGVRG